MPASRRESGHEAHDPAAIAAIWLTGAAQAAAPRSYEPPSPAPDPAAQLGEMLSLYDEICLRTFP